MKVALKNCSKIKKHNKNILDTLENNKEVNFKVSELINIKNDLYKDVGNNINIQNLDLDEKSIENIKSEFHINIIKE